MWIHQTQQNNYREQSRRKKDRKGSHVVITLRKAFKTLGFILLNVHQQHLIPHSISISFILIKLKKDTNRDVKQTRFLLRHYSMLPSPQLLTENVTHPLPDLSTNLKIFLYICLLLSYSRTISMFACYSKLLEK